MIRKLHLLEPKKEPDHGDRHLPQDQGHSRNTCQADQAHRQVVHAKDEHEHHERHDSGSEEKEEGEQEAGGQEER